MAARLQRIFLISFFGFVTVMLGVGASTFSIGGNELGLQIRAGRIMRSIEGPSGILYKIPLFDEIRVFDASARRTPISGRYQNISDGYTDVKGVVYWRISSPAKLFTAVRRVDNAERQIALISQGVLNALVGNQEFLSSLKSPVVLSSCLKPAVVVKDVLEKTPCPGETGETIKLLKSQVGDLGVEILDIRVVSAVPSSEVMKEIEGRMVSSWANKAEYLIAEGSLDAKQRLADADVDAAKIVSNAEIMAKISEEAKDSEIFGNFAEHFGKDPLFYRLYSVMSSYQQGIGRNANILLSDTSIVSNPMSEVRSSILSKNNGGNQ